MKSATPKLLHPLAGVADRRHTCCATAQALDAAHVVAVVRHERDQVAAAVESRACPAASSSTRTRSPAPAVRSSRRVAALPDDFTGEVLVRERRRAAARRRHARRFLEQHRGRRRGGDPCSRPSTTTRPATAASCAAPTAPSTASSSRRTRPTPSARSARSTPASTCSARAPLRDQLANLTTDNAQGEKYLTDVIGLLREAGSEVEAVPVSEPWLVAGINDRAQLSEAARPPERAHRARLAARPASPSRTRRPPGSTSTCDARARRHHPPRHAAQGRDRRSPPAR